MELIILGEMFGGSNYCLYLCSVENEKRGKDKKRSEFTNGLQQLLESPIK